MNDFQKGYKRALDDLVNLDMITLFQMKKVLKLKKAFPKIQDEKEKEKTRFEGLLNKAYGTFLEELSNGTYDSSDLYKFITEHFGKDEKGYFVDSDGFYFLDQAIRQREIKR